MTLSVKALQEKDSNISAMNHVLYRAKTGDIFKIKDPVLVEPSLYLTIYTEVLDPIEYFKKGYIIDIDTLSFKAIGARYFTSEGKDTYTEVELSTRQFRDLVQYFKINEMDLIGMFLKKIKE